MAIIYSSDGTVTVSGQDAKGGGTAVYKGGVMVSYTSPSTSSSSQTSRTTTSSSQPSPRSSQISQSFVSDVAHFNQAHSGEFFYPAGDKQVIVNPNLPSASRAEAEKVAARLGWQVVQGTYTPAKVGGGSASVQLSTTQTQMTTAAGPQTQTTNAQSSAQQTPPRSSVWYYSGWYDTSAQNTSTQSASDAVSRAIQAARFASLASPQKTQSGNLTISTPTPEHSYTKEEKEEIVRNVAAVHHEQYISKSIKGLESVPVVGEDVYQLGMTLHTGMFELEYPLLVKDNRPVGQKAMEVAGGSMKVASASFGLASIGMSIGGAVGAGSLATSAFAQTKNLAIAAEPLIVFGERSLGAGALYTATTAASQVITGQPVEVSGRTFVRGAYLGYGASEFGAQAFPRLTQMTGSAGVSTVITGATTTSLFAGASTAAAGESEKIPQTMIVSGVIGGALAGAAYGVEKAGYRLEVGTAKTIIQTEQGTAQITTGVKFGIGEVSKSGDIKFTGYISPLPEWVQQYRYAPAGLAESVAYGNANVYSGYGYVFRQGSISQAKLQENLQKSLGEDYGKVIAGIKQTNGIIGGSNVEKAISTPKGILGEIEGARAVKDVDVVYYGGGKGQVEQLAKSVGGTMKEGEAGISFINMPNLFAKYEITTPSGKQIDVSVLDFSAMTPRMAGAFGEFTQSASLEKSSLGITTYTAQQQAATKAATISFESGFLVPFEASKEKYIQDTETYLKLAGQKVNLNTPTTEKVAAQLSLPQLFSTPITTTPSMTPQLSLPSMQTINTPSMNVQRVMQELSISAMFSSTSVISLPSPSVSTSKSSSLVSLPSSQSSSKSSIPSEISSSSSSSSPSSPSLSVPSSPSSSPAGSSLLSPSSDSTNQFNLIIVPPPPILPFVPLHNGGFGGGAGAFGTGRGKKQLRGLLEAVQIRTPKINLRGG